MKTRILLLLFLSFFFLFSCDNKDEIIEEEPIEESNEVIPTEFCYSDGLETEFDIIDREALLVKSPAASQSNAVSESKSTSYIVIDFDYCDDQEIEDSPTSWMSTLCKLKDIYFHVDDASGMIITRFYRLCNFPEEARNWDIPEEGLPVLITGKIYPQDFEFWDWWMTRYGYSLDLYTIKKKDYEESND